MFCFLLPRAVSDVGRSIHLCLDLGIENVPLDLPSRNPEYPAFPGTLWQYVPIITYIPNNLFFLQFLWYLSAFLYKKYQVNYSLLSLLIVQFISQCCT